MENIGNEEQKQTIPETQSLKPFSLNQAISTPLSILGAGVIIAMAIIYSNTGTGVNIKKSNPDNKQVQKLSQVSVPLFKQCLDSGKNTQKVESQSQDAVAAGGRGTPYSVIVDKNGKLFAFSGALPHDQVKVMVDNALAGKAQLGKSDVDNINMKPVSSDDHILGSISAPVKIVEFSDMECPFCKRFHATMQQVVKENNGQVAWVYRHFPLDQLHSKARKEAEATECATDQGGNEKFWAYLNRLMEVTPSNNGLDLAELLNIAAFTGLK